jgi:hypothetical protein
MAHQLIATALLAIGGATPVVIVARMLHDLIRRY